MKGNGIFYILISVVSFSIVNVFVKSLEDIPPHELIFFRSLISLAISAYVIRSLKIPFFGVNRKWLVLRGVFGMSALTLFFYTLKSLPLASATSIQYLSPIFTVIFAVYLNKQYVKKMQWVYFAIAFLGVILIKWGDHRVSLLYLSLGILSASLAGLAYNAIIKCRATDHPITVVMYFPLIAVPVMGVWCMFDWHMPEGIEWFYLLLIGVLTQIAQIYMTKALHADSASRVTPFKYVGSVIAIILGYTIFDETLYWWSILGIALVVAGVTINTLTTSAYKTTS